MRRVTRSLIRVLAALSAAGAIAAGTEVTAVPIVIHAANGSASVQGTGTWLNDGICVPIVPPPGADIACTGASIWHGPLLTGTTTYTAIGNFTSAGDIVGTATETFTGSAANGARGTIALTEALSLKAMGERYAVRIAANAVDGTGDFCHVKGQLVFTGTSDVSGIGSGLYFGHIVTPKNSG